MLTESLYIAPRSQRTFSFCFKKSGKVCILIRAIPFLPFIYLRDSLGRVIFRQERSQNVSSNASLGITSMPGKYELTFINKIDESGAVIIEIDCSNELGLDKVEIKKEVIPDVVQDVVPKQCDSAKIKLSQEEELRRFLFGNGVESLHYMAHKDNLNSILKLGIRPANTLPLPGPAEFLKSRMLDQTFF
jgi:hypothetical protein